MVPSKILIMGLPGAGKTTLAKALVEKLRAVGLFKATLIDGDAMRQLHSDMDFSEGGRLRQAFRMGQAADRAVEQGYTAVCSFVCPTAACRGAFWQGSPRFTVFVDRVDESPYENTNAIFVPPDDTNYVVCPDDTVEATVNALARLFGAYAMDETKPTALLIGRFQPFHAGHKALVARAIEEVGQCIIGLRNTPVDEQNPLTAMERLEDITLALDSEFAGRYDIIVLPNVTKVVYGRTPGYDIEQYHLGAELEAISGTKIREGTGL
jgi:adenylylsulfate kinase